jgi:hypothetical protein
MAIEMSVRSDRSTTKEVFCEASDLEN